MEIARLDGPLRDDAALALGRIGDQKAIPTLSALQQEAPRHDQPVIAAAICLTGRNCESHRGFIRESLVFAADQIGHQELLRSAAAGLGALAERGDVMAFDHLLEAGIPSHDPVRAPIALAVGRVAVRNPVFMLERLAQTADLDGAVLLLRDAFDMLEEDLAEERFFAAVRREYWKAPEKTPTRRVGQQLITVPEF
jgi:hypothetical protein